MIVKSDKFQIVDDVWENLPFLHKLEQKTLIFLYLSLAIPEMH